jgi:GAF domain-containing protein
MQRRILYLNSLLQAVAEVHDLLIREQNVTVILPQICQKLVNARSLQLCWMGRVEESRVVPIAQAPEAEELQRLPEISPGCDLSQGPVGAALRTGQPVLLDLADDSPPQQDLGRAFGCASVLAVPIPTKKSVWGVLNVFSREGGAFIEEGRSVLMDLAGDIGLALEAEEERLERARSEEALRQQKRRSSTL